LQYDKSLRTNHSCAVWLPALTGFEISGLPNLSSCSVNFHWTLLRIHGLALNIWVMVIIVKYKIKKNHLKLPT